MNIAQQLHTLMVNAKISRSRLAREIGVHTSTVTNWLDGKEPKAEHLSVICEYFGCSLDYLSGKTFEDTKKSPVNDDEGFEDIDFAFFGDYRELTESDKETLRVMAEHLRKKSNDADRKT